jgi:hypothetical protein
MVEYIDPVKEEYKYDCVYDGEYEENRILL